MARLFYVTKDKYGFKYRENNIYGWNHFDNSVIDQASMIKYLTENGRYNKPAIVFTNEAGKPARIYEVTKKNGSIIAIVDGADKLPLIRQHFVSDSEAGDFFKSNEHSEKVIKEAEKLQPQERLKYYQDNATEVTKDEYDRLVSDKLSNDSLTEYFKKQAAIDNMGAEILFK